jgi:putative hydrolase of the HAD superfamily
VFDVVVISTEVGLRKPQPEIYELALDRLGLAHDQVVLVDDGAPNVAAAERLGITGILHTHPEATAAAVGRLIPDRPTCTTDPIQKEHIP